MEWMMDADQAIRQVVVDLEERADEIGWDQPPILIDVRVNLEDGDVMNIETDPIAFGEHPIDMMKGCFDEGWRPMALLVIAEGNRTMQVEEAMLMPEWENLPELVRKNWRDVMMQFPPTAMEPFCVEVRTALYVDAGHEMMLIRDRGGQPSWLDGEDSGQIVEVARNVIRGVEPLV